MDLRETLQALESLGTEQNRKVYRRHGADDNQYGVSYANLETLAITTARRISPVEVDHGETNCKTPDAIPYIQKARPAGQPGNRQLVQWKVGS